MPWEILSDVRSVKERDPAARSTLEIILCYPGLHAVWGHRISHRWWQSGAKLPARVLAEIMRILTGVEIHPGAVLGSGVFIDHATGVVIGETAVVGNDVTIYHGVTLGGTSLDRVKRHPTVEDGVIIGAGAKVLGAITIGAGSQIGANSVVVKTVPPGSVVVGVPGQIIGHPGGTPSGTDQSNLPDPMGVSMQSLLSRVSKLEARADGPGTERVIRPPEAGVWYGEDFSI
jgi:serine O-acetyltransferase